MNNPKKTKSPNDLFEQMKKARELQLKSHERGDDLFIEQPGNGAVKIWQWCFTHERFEKAGWI